jgi:transcription elongation GreA/GreB family factor
VIISPHVRLPTHVVTLDTHVTLQDRETHEVMEVVLTIPQGATFTSGGEVSVLDPLGTALLGCMHGDVIVVHTGGVPRELKVVHVRQSPVAKAAATLDAW